MSNALGTLFGDIANAIREKNGETGTMKPAEFPEKISAIETGGGSSGGGTLPVGAYWQESGNKKPIKYDQKWFTLNGNVYAIARDGTGAGGTANIYKLSDGAWTVLVSAFDFGIPITTINVTEYNGEVHFTGNDTTKHVVWDGTANNPTVKTALPYYIYTDAAFVQNDVLKIHSNYNGTVYAWDAASDTWTAEATIGSKYYYFYPIGDSVYCINSQTVYKYTGAAIEQVGTLTASTKQRESFGKYIYYTTNGVSYSPYKIYKYDTTTHTDSLVGTLPGLHRMYTFYKYDDTPRMLIGGYDYGFAELTLHEIEATE